MKTNHVDVLVTGGGPVGLATAIFAAEAGRTVAVVEAKPRGVAHSYALALHPPTMELLDSIDVAGDILARALPVRSIGVYAGARKLLSLPVAAAGAKFPFLSVVGQDVLESVLARALLRRGVRVNWSHRMAQFTASASGVDATIDEMEESLLGYAVSRLDWMVKAKRTCRAKYLVGADGCNSLVRRASDIDFPEVGAAEHVAVFEFQRADVDGHEMAIVLHPAGLGVLWPLPGGRGRWSFVLAPELAPEAWREKDHEPVQILGPGVFPSLDEAMLQRLLAERAPWFDAKYNHVYWRMMVRFERRVAASFGAGRVWLAGDAAHLTGPAGIQSMNTGLREARDVVRGLVATDNDSGRGDALRAYNTARTIEWQRLLGVSGSLQPTAATLREIAPYAQQLLACLPASGDMLDLLAGQLGLQWVDRESPAAAAATAAPVTSLRTTAAGAADRGM